jgi:ribosomal protein L24E
MGTIRCDLMKARKPHRCDFCGNQIEIGEKYYSEVNVNDGKIYRWKSHYLCEDFVQSFCCDYDGDGIDADAFRDQLDEMAREIGLDTELDTYELVKKIMEVKG